MTDAGAMAFLELQAFARRVARELIEQGRPRDRLAEAQPSLVGWRVWQADTKVTIRQGSTRHIGWQAIEVEWQAIWLNTSGELLRAWITEQTHRGNIALRKKPTEKSNRMAEVQPLDLGFALAFSGHPPWRETRRWEGDVEIYGGHRLEHRARPGTPPCLGVSKVLADLRSHQHERNIITSYG